MATVRSRFLSVGVAEPNLNTGFTVRILDYKDMKTLVAFCPEFTALSFSQELNGVGTGSISLDEDSPWWSNRLNDGQSNRAIMDNEYVFEIWDNGSPLFAFLAQTMTKSVVGADEIRTVTISGPGIAQVLTWAIVNRPGFPTPPPTVDYITDPQPPHAKTPVPLGFSNSDLKPAYAWKFDKGWSTMRMWYTLLKAAQRRGVIPFVTPMFTALQDSGRQDFQYVKTLEQVSEDEGFSPTSNAENLLDMLNDCTGRDFSKWFSQRLEWIMHPGFKLEVRRKIGADVSKNVRFFSGNIISDERTKDRETIYNRVIVVDDQGYESIRLDTKSVAAWNLRELRNEDHKNLTDNKMRGVVADALLVQNAAQKDEWAIKIPYDDPGRKPFRNFRVGDYIGVNDATEGLTVDNTTLPPPKYRVMAIAISLSADQNTPDCELTLLSLIDSKLLELEKKITKLLNDPVNFDIVGLKDVKDPNQPIIKASSLVYNPKTKKWEVTPTTELATGSSGSVYIQATDPAAVSGNTVKTGDFWYDTDG